MSYPQNNLRPVQINFDLYIDSDDAEFKLELILLMLSNLDELMEASHKAWTSNDISAFQSTTHKTKSTVTLLDDRDLNDAIEDVKRHLAEGATQQDPRALDRLIELCTSIRSSLEYEATLLKGKR